MTGVTEAQRPNFVVIMSDDQGYGDLGCMGANDLATPHLDRLASQGAVFTDCYSNSPVCSPSRASLMSGRFPARAGVRDVLGGHRTETGLPRDVPTVATALGQLGYRTGLVGKWHLGVAPGFRPTDHGFDEWFGMLSGGVDYFSHINYNLWPWDSSYEAVHDLWENDEEVWRNGEYVTELITSEAVDFISRAGDEPFFLHVAYNAPHSPMHAPAEYLDRFPGLTPARRIMAAMISAMDDGIGLIIAELERRGVLDETCIIFTSDNGPSRQRSNWLDGSMEPYYGGSAGALKGGKTSLFEGGIRTPTLMRWPGRIPSGRVISDAVAVFDLFPTLVTAAGGFPEHWGVDGVDLTPIFDEKAAPLHEELFWEFRDQTAIRRGPWKLVLNGSEHELAVPDDPVFLSNLDDDIGEQTNLAGEFPEIAAELRTSAEAWRSMIEEDWSARGSR